MNHLYIYIYIYIYIIVNYYLSLILLVSLIHNVVYAYIRVKSINNDIVTIVRPSTPTIQSYIYTLKRLSSYSMKFNVAQNNFNTFPKITVKMYM